VNKCVPLRKINQVFDGLTLILIPGFLEKGTQNVFLGAELKRADNDGGLECRHSGQFADGDFHGNFELAPHRK